MGKIYVGQVLDIELDTKIELTGATAPTIRAIAHDGTVTSWSAVVSGTLLTYTTAAAEGETPADLNQAGQWRLQAIPNVTGAEAPGETVVLTVYSLGR